ILVQRRYRDRVFYTSVSVKHLSHVVEIGRATFRDYHHLKIAGRLDDLLALVAPRLVVAFDAERAGRPQPLEVSLRVVVAIDHRFLGILRSIEDVAGRKNARTCHRTGLYHLRLREDGLS